MSNEKTIVGIVDDDPEIRIAMARTLSAFGYGAETFNSAKTFLVCASTSKATCLLVDIQLGDISGIELPRQLATNGFKFPIIFMSGLNDEVIRRQAADAGGIAFLRKPFLATVLIDAIKLAIGAVRSLPTTGYPAVARSEQGDSATKCGGCGGRLIEINWTPAERPRREPRRPLVTYFRCEQCEQVKIVEI